MLLKEDMSLRKIERAQGRTVKRRQSGSKNDETKRRQNRGWVVHQGMRRVTITIMIETQKVPDKRRMYKK